MKARRTFRTNGRFWKIIDDHKVSIFYTAPTAIRAFIKWGDEWVHKHSLAVAAAAGDGGRADQSRSVDVVLPRDWQGALPDCGHVVADGDGRDHDFADSGSGGDQAGIGDAAVLRDCAGSGYERRRAGAAGAGRAAGDSQAVAVDGADDLGRCGALREDIFVGDSGSYFTGDGARWDADGYYWLMGRVDDVINVSGHRLGTMEIESALVAHPKVAEAAVVGRPDDLEGPGDCGVCDAGGGVQAERRSCARELRQWVAKEIGALARPDDLRFTQMLPKTRSGKIMRRLLRELAKPAR